MSVMSKAVLVEPLVDSIERENVCTNDSVFLELDLTTCKVEDLDFSNIYSFRLLRDEKVHALVTWFDAEFSRLTNPVKFSTGPYTKYTHWK